MNLPAPVGCALIRFALVGGRIGAVLFRLVGLLKRLSVKCRKSCDFCTLLPFWLFHNDFLCFNPQTALRGNYDNISGNAESECLRSLDVLLVELAVL